MSSMFSACPDQVKVRIQVTVFYQSISADASDLILKLTNRLINSVSGTMKQQLFPTKSNMLYFSPSYRTS